MAKDPLKKVRSLRQTDETWQGTARLARVWITPRNQVPYRPYVVIFIERGYAAAGRPMPPPGPLFTPCDCWANCAPIKLLNRCCR